MGLTGIGSGKSSAALYFAELRAGIIDVDGISHALTCPGAAAIVEICSQFGPQSIAADGTFDRARMREQVFSDASAKARLEAILQPLIGKQSRQQVLDSTQPYVILVVPLLLERNTYRDAIHRVAVVDCPETLQIKRTMRRSALSEEAVHPIIRAQLRRAERRAKADDVICNDGNEAHLHRQVAVLHARYLEFAESLRRE